MFGNFVKNMRSRNGNAGYSEGANNSNTPYEDPTGSQVNDYGFAGFPDNTQDNSIPSNVLSNNVIDASNDTNNNIITNENTAKGVTNPASPPPKKGRGRPRSTTKKEKPVIPGRGRGRPKGSIKPDAACRLQKPPVPGRSRGRPKGSKKKVGTDVGKASGSVKAPKKEQKILPTNKVVGNYSNEEVHDMNTPYIY